MDQCNICKFHIDFCNCATPAGHIKYINKFQDNETVFLKDQGINLTVDKWSYIPSKRTYTYTTIENPSTFYFEYELDFASSDAPETTASPSEAAADKGLILTEEELYAIENSYGLYTPALAERYHNVVDIIASHRSLLSANAELSFKNEDQRKTIDKQHILLDKYESMINGGSNE